MVKRYTLQIGTVLSIACTITCVRTEAQALPRSSSLLTGGVVAGLVRDASGLPQMGALVQVLLPDATLAASAVTDPGGRYRLVGLPSGVYEIRATAARCLPAVRNHLRIQRGSSSVVNLTLATILSTTQWLPTTRRPEVESLDDWTWTLRSSANRPILRLRDATDSSSNEVLSSSSSADRQRPLSQGRVTLTEGEGGFSRGGAHSIFLVSSSADGGGAILQADLSQPLSGYPFAPSSDVSIGLQSSSSFGGVTRSVLSYSSHPELVGTGNSAGLQAAVLRSAHRFTLGEGVEVDAGSVVIDENMSGNVFAAEPFMRVSVRPLADLQLTYGYTEAAGTESLEDLDRVAAPVPVAMDSRGRPGLPRGRHQSLSAATRIGHRGTLELAAYRDRLESATVDGSGTLTSADLKTGGLLFDATTQTFRALVRGYNGSGWRVFVNQPITSALALSAQATGGEALAAADATPRSLDETLASVRPVHTAAFSVAADGRILRTGTVLHTGYRWQRAGTLTAVDPFHSREDRTYLNCVLRQPLRISHVFPPGTQAVVDVSNLLAQGYQPFLSQDGRVLFLAQSPRMLQAGLSFNF